jgi:hypothetical protein
MPTAGFERPLREACPNFFREYDQVNSAKLDRALKGLPNELKPDEEGFLAYIKMRRLFQAALIVASFGFANCEGAYGKTIDEQLDELREWLLNKTPPQWLVDKDAAAEEE